MSDHHGRASIDVSGRLEPTPELVARLRAQVPAVAREAVQEIIAQIPGYADLRGDPGVVLDEAVQLALGAFCDLLAASAAGSAGREDPGASPIPASTTGAYDLGRGEARSGRSMDLLLAAYRIGARVSWRRFSRTAVEGGMSASSLGALAELVFAYIDELGAASVAGHADELESSGRARERHLAALAGRIATGADPEAVDEAAARAGWEPPRTLTCVLVPEGQAARVLAGLPSDTLRASSEVIGMPDAAHATDAADAADAPDRDHPGEERALLLVPDLTAGARSRLVADLRGRGCVVSSTLPWRQAQESVRRARSALRLTGSTRETVDVDARLVDLVLDADPQVRADLARRLLQPLDDVRPAQREALVDTLRSWLLHLGRRADVAADLHVHPQTVRYRMTQLRQRYGERLDDPRTVLALLVALGPGPRRAEPVSAASGKMEG